MCQGRGRLLNTAYRCAVRVGLVSRSRYKSPASAEVQSDTANKFCTEVDISPRVRQCGGSTGEYLTDMADCGPRRCKDDHQLRSGWDVCSWNTGDLGAYFDGPASSFIAGKYARLWPGPGTTGAFRSCLMSLFMASWLCRLV